MSLENLPEINFIDVNIEKLLNSMVKEYQEAYYAETGNKIELQDGDKVKIWIYSQALRLYQMYKYMNEMAKQNYLKYACGECLDNFAARYKNMERLQATKAHVKIKFYLSTVLGYDTVIPGGTKVTAGDNVFFETINTAIIQAGNTDIEVVAECTTSGNVGNNYDIGLINTLVNPIAYINKVENITVSQGGSNVEDDENFRNRLYLAPEGFSTAGSAEAYKFHCLKFSEQISDINVFSENPGEVTIIILLKNGVIPEEVFLNELLNYINDSSIRPLTDKVLVEAPKTINYSINLTYYIKKSDSDREETINQKINEAIDEYIDWQKECIGRDINPSFLIGKMINAGAKRVEIETPIFSIVDDKSVAVLENKTVQYGGLEND